MRLATVSTNVKYATTGGAVPAEAELCQLWLFLVDG